MIPLSKVKFDELKRFLNDNYVFGHTVSRRKRTLIYNFERCMVSLGRLKLRVKVMAKTKYVMSVVVGENVITDYDEFKKRILWKPGPKKT